MVTISFKMLRPKKEEFFFLCLPVFAVHFVSSSHLHSSSDKSACHSSSLAWWCSVSGNKQDGCRCPGGSENAYTDNQKANTLGKYTKWFFFFFFFPSESLFKGLLQKINIVPHWLCISNLLEALGFCFLSLFAFSHKPKSFEQGNLPGLQESLIAEYNLFFSFLQDEKPRVKWGSSGERIIITRQTRLFFPLNKTLHGS